MAVTFTNDWKNILDKLRNVLRTEYGGTLPIYIGADESNAGTQYIRLEPAGSELTEYNTNSGGDMSPSSDVNYTNWFI